MTVAPLFDSGLTIHDRGVEGVIFETSATHHAAVARYLLAVDAISVRADAPQGSLLLLLLVHQELVLDLTSLRAATSSTASTYCADQDCYVEWDAGRGWIDRRKLTLITKFAIEANGGSRVRRSDWSWLSEALHQLYLERPIQHALSDFIAGARAYWVTRTTGPLFGHAIRIRPFQMLPRASLARKFSELPQRLPHEPQTTLSAELRYAQSVRGYSKATATLEDLVTFAGSVSREKGAKHVGRGRIIERINQLLPLAATEGRVQVIVLGAIKHAVEFGGVRGGLLAPVSIYEYLRQGITTLAVALLAVDIDELDGWEWLDTYRKIISKIKESQRKKFTAFLEVFHRFLIISDVVPLPHGIAGKEPSRPPNTSVVWPHELKRALDFVQNSGAGDAVQLQAKVALVSGYWIPLRTNELWCLRVEDVKLLGTVILTIYPRVIDGSGKAKSTRREEEVLDDQLKALLIDMVGKRRHLEFAGEQDYLFGARGKSGASHEESATNDLVNASLRWATGDVRASFYDLRHSAFSRRAAPILAGNGGPTDVSQFSKVSSEGGHAGPASTYPYVHQVEEAIADQPRQSSVAEALRLNLSTRTKTMFCFEWIGHAVLADGVPPLPTLTTSQVGEANFDAVSFAARAEIVWLVAKNFPLPVIAGGCRVSLETVYCVVAQHVEAMIHAGLVHHSMRASLRKQCLAIGGYKLWSRAARQPKLAALFDSLQKSCHDGSWSSLNHFWQDWLRCRSGDDLDVSDPRPAIRLVNLLVKSGIPHSALLQINAEGTGSLTRDWTALKIQSRQGSPRKGRVPHRLFIVDSGRSAKNSSGASISMRGFHWLMLLVGSVLLARSAELS